MANRRIPFPDIVHPLSERTIPKYGCPSRPSIHHESSQNEYMLSRQLRFLMTGARYVLFVLAAALGSGLVSLWFGVSETWEYGGQTVNVSNAGRWILFLSGFVVGGIESAVISIVATRFASKYVARVGSIAAAVIGFALGCLTGFSFCLVISVAFFTFPSPELWKIMTEKR